MRRTDRFVMSHRPYAVDLSSLVTTRDAAWRIGAVWFRRRKGVTVACVGYLWDYQRTAPKDAGEFLAAHDDGRYGGTTLGRWDGHGYWGAEDPDLAAAHLELLRPMLADFPAIPAGYSGWWTFRPEGDDRG